MALHLLQICRIYAQKCTKMLKYAVICKNGTNMPLLKLQHAKYAEYMMMLEKICKNMQK